MNTTDLRHFRALIHSRLEELTTLSALGQGSQSVVELDQQSVGRLSRMDALQNQAMAKAQQARRDVEVLRLHEALARIEEDAFGYCEDCGEQIAKGRLELNLAACKCVSCASG